jgi:hypothetical protein
MLEVLTFSLTVSKNAAALASVPLASQDVALNDVDESWVSDAEQWCCRSNAASRP